ncbi:hypothetical protein RvY_08194 [Ramazzottius varieornatus]|uniref:Uncharacterized protein n=1 Tax=Ramazzottius varieornatus TaxID=947166 RepID=A0A1D1V4X4_RAMVA|nr:hypothetical protein RvY_08194 [Ramazzottius varieornatus]
MRFVKVRLPWFSSTSVVRHYLIDGELLEPFHLLGLECPKGRRWAFHAEDINYQLAQKDGYYAHDDVFVH